MKSIVKLIINLLIATIFTVGLFVYPETVPAEWLVGGVEIGIGLMLLLIAFVLGILTESLWKFVYTVIPLAVFFISNRAFNWSFGATEVAWFVCWIIGLTGLGLIVGTAVRQGAVRVVELFT